MKIQRACKVCGNDFLAIKITQFFCSRKCFKRDYYVKTRERLEDQAPGSRFPSKKCLFCSESSELDFDPANNPEKFNAWECPKCGASNTLIWEHRNSPQSYQVISELLLTIETNAQTGTFYQTEYKVYNLPIVRPGSKKNHIVVLTCEPLDIINIQKGNRKKILFS